MLIFGVCWLAVQHKNLILGQQQQQQHSFQAINLDNLVSKLQEAKVQQSHSEEETERKTQKQQLQQRHQQQQRQHLISDETKSSISSSSTAATATITSFTTSTTTSSTSVGHVLEDFIPNVQIGKTYNGNCRLVPQWGVAGGSGEDGTGTAVTADSKKNSTIITCVDPNPTNPTTQAQQLTCDDIDFGKQQHPSRRRSDTTNTQKNVLTIGILYYARPSRLLRQLETFVSSYPIHIQNQISILIVDDGSPVGLRATEYLDIIEKSHSQQQVGGGGDINSPFQHLHSIRIVRVLIDKAFNHGGARNLACYVCETEKILLLDLDMLIDQQMIQQILPLSLIEQQEEGEGTGQRRSIAHRFNRIRPTTTTDSTSTLSNDGLHPAIMLANVSTYWNSGGCDEDFVGSYGHTDKHFWYKWNLDSTHKGLIDHYDIYLHEFAINGCNFTTLGSSLSTATATTTNSVALSSNMISQQQIDKCNDALKKLKQTTKSSTKRIPRINKEKLDYKMSTGCWSNTYLQFPWIVER